MSTASNFLKRTFTDCNGDTIADPQLNKRIKQEQKENSEVHIPKYRISASEIASVLGRFGVTKQFNTIKKMLSKTEHRNLLRSLPQHNDEGTNREYLRIFGLYNEWNSFCSQIYTDIKTLKDLIEGRKQAINMLFLHPNVQNHWQLRQQQMIKAQIQGADELEDKWYQLQESTTVEEVQQAVDEFQDIQSKRDILVMESFAELLSQGVKCLKYFDQQMACTYGRTGEKQFVEQFNQLHDTEDHIIKDNQILEIQILPNLSLTGIPDGRIGVDKQLVEIKHRQRKMFKNIPGYELLQLYAYMHLDNNVKIRHIQCIRLDTMMYSETQMVYFNPEIWEAILISLKSVIIFIERLVSDTLTWDCFCRLSPDSQLQICQKNIKFPHLVQLL